MRPVLVLKDFLMHNTWWSNGLRAHKTGCQKDLGIQIIRSGNKERGFLKPDF